MNMTFNWTSQVMTFSLNDFLSCVPVLSHSSLKSLLGKAVRNDDGVFVSSAGESFSTAEAAVLSVLSVLLQNLSVTELLLVFFALGCLWSLRKA